MTRTGDYWVTGDTTIQGFAAIANRRRLSRHPTRSTALVQHRATAVHFTTFVAANPSPPHERSTSRASRNRNPLPATSLLVSQTTFAKPYHVLFE